MNSEELQFFSDAVKIGFPVLGTVFGAVVGAVATYFVTKLNHQKEESKESARRRYELLIQTATDITDFEHRIGKYSSAVSNKVQGLAGAIDFEEARLDVVKNNHPLRRARMSLKLLGLKDSEKHLEDYLVLTREVIRFGPNLTAARASELSKLIVVGPVKFYESLAQELAVK